MATASALGWQKIVQQLIAWALLGALFVVSSVEASTIRYGVFFEDPRWQAMESPIQCELYQDIPSYGRAVFQAKAGYEEGFVVERFSESRQVGKAVLAINPPPWRHHEESQVLGKISLHPGDTPFRLNRDTASRLQDSLNLGWFVSISYPTSTRNTVLLGISPLNFKMAHRKYLDCLEQLLPFKIDELDSMTIQFSAESTHLTDETKAALERYCQYVKAELPFSKIVLSGYSDNNGTAQQNIRNSAERVTAIKNFLVKNGIPNDKIQTFAFGDSNPIAMNDTQAGRAKNRRVELEFVR